MNKPPPPKHFLLCISVFIFVSFLRNPATGQVVAANNCAAALSLTPSISTCTTNTSTVASSTLDGATSTCQGTAKYDVWYKFTASANSAAITLTGVQSGFANPAIQVLDGCGGNVIACGGTSTAAPLTSGSTYYIRIFSTTAGAIPTTNANFTICILNGSANDICEDAVLLTSAGTCSTPVVGSLTHATNFTLVNNCEAGGGTRIDAWYKFVAQSTNPIITTVKTGGSGLRRSELYEGTCVSLTALNQCSGDANNLYSTNLTIGNTYYVRVYSTSASVYDFTICVVDPVENDLSINAVSLTSAGTCTTPVTGTLTNATYTAGNGVPGLTPCNGTTADAWYKFVAHSTNPIITVTKTDAGAGSRRSEIYEGDGVVLNSLTCSGNNNNLYSSGLTIGQTYYIRVYLGNATAYDFTICVVDPVANDLIVNAVSLTSASTCATPVAGTLTNATYTAGNGVPGLTPCNGATADAWYKFVAHSTNPVITVAKTDAGGGSRRSEIYEGDGVVVNSMTCSGNFNNLNSSGLTIGETYYVRVYLGNTTPYDFTICVVDPVANDLCVNAVAITSGPGCTATSGTLTNSTNTALANTCDASSGTRIDVWYKFVAQSTNPVITNTFVSGTNQRRSELYADCSTSTSLYCSGNSNNIFASGLTIGQTYFIRVFANSASPYDFTICVVDPPANDLCAGAIAISPTGLCSPTAGNFHYATPSTPVGTACAANLYDLWYKFTLPSNPEATYASIAVAFTSGTSSLTSGNTSIELYNTGNCPVDNLSLGCSAIDNNRNPKSFTGLTPGATYLFRISTSSNTTVNSANWGFTVCVTTFKPFAVGSSGRMREVFQQTVLSPPGVLADPWEITYGPDSKLWITESKGYKVYTMDPATGVKTTVLNISQNSTFLPPAEQVFNCQFGNGNGAQGGLAGLALHPKFLDPVTPKNYVYLSYIYSQTSGTVFVNRVVRFTYNTGTGLLESPVAICDTIPGSSDHNSQRMIIKPVGGTNYLFYAAGDMGAGQFGNALRANKAQNTDSYEGKILRFNLEPDGDGAALDQWIPNDNPYSASLGVQSAVWCIGMRNNQGFVYDASLDRLYGSSHGPFSDDEINIIEPARNYGHPLVIGYSWDDNVNGTTAGAAPGMSPAHPSSCPLIVDESDNAAAIGASYKDPLFSAYPNSTLFPSINALWNTLPTTPGNGSWPSEGWSGLDLYQSPLIPGWKHSLVAASLKWGRLLKFKLNTTGDVILPTDGADTVSYFGSTNRFRDMAFAPNGKDIYVIMDRSSTTSGPSALNPIIPACPGCVQKYTFLGYADNGGKSSIPDAIDVTQGTTNFISNAGTTVTIDAGNSNYWVPITGSDGNILAEIFANGQNLGTVTSSFYQHSGPIRIKGSVHYLNRSITINPSIAPTGPVKVRFYISKTEYDALDADVASSLTTPGQLKIFKNSDANGSVMTAATTSFFPHLIELRGTASDAYVLQSDTISSFSTFYFAAVPVALPVELISFTGNLQNDNTVLLKWQTSNEINASHFVVERSTDGSRFSPIGTLTANGNGTALFNYFHIDAEAGNQSSAKLYYRLKMVDLDAKYTYSTIVTITLPYISGLVSVYPNPFTTDLTVVIGAPKDGNVQWKLIDNNGRTVMQRSASVKKGNNTLQISVNKLPSGFYYLRIEGAGISNKVKLQKQ